MAGLDPAIHVFFSDMPISKTWTPGTSPREGNLFCRASHGELEAIVGGDDFDLVAVAADFLVADRLAEHLLDPGVVTGGLVVKQHKPPDPRQLRQFDGDDIAGVSPVLFYGDRVGERIHCV